MHLSFSAKINIFARGGSNGNSTIFRPNGVNAPVLSNACRICKGGDGDPKCVCVCVCALGWPWLENIMHYGLHICIHLPRDGYDWNSKQAMDSLYV